MPQKENEMRKSASETIRNLEMRIARLESLKTSKTAGGFYGNSTKIDHNKCVIMLDTHDSSEQFNYCFMHMNDSLLNSAVKSFMSDMKQGQKMGIVEDAWVTSKSDSCVCISIEFEPDLDQTDAVIEWMVSKCWERPNTINIG